MTILLTVEDMFAYPMVNIGQVTSINSLKWCFIKKISI